MTISLLSPDGLPLTAQQERQANAPRHGGGAGRPLGGRSGFRVDTAPDTLTATSTTWTLKPCSAEIDPGATVNQGMYGWASDQNITGAITPADQTNARKDIVYIQINDSTAGDNSGEVTYAPKYLAGTASTSPVSPWDDPAKKPARAFLVGTIDVPKLGGGAPTATLNPARYVAAGGILPITFGYLAALDKYDGLQICRTDLPGRPVFTWDGSKWGAPALGFLGQQTNAAQTVTGTGQNALVTNTVTLEPNRRIRVTAKVTAKPDTANLYAEYQIYAGGIGLDTFVKRFTAVNLGESLEFTAAHGSGAGGPTQFSLQCRVVDPSGTTGLVKSDAFTVKLIAHDDGNG